jgi:type IV pilus assembly protein PilN
MRLTLNLSSRTYLNRRKLYLAYAVLGAVLVLILAAQLNYWFQVRNQRKLLLGRLAELEVSLGISTEEAISNDDFKQLMEKISYSNSLISRANYRWTGLLGQLEKVIPAEVRITQIRPDFQKGTLALSGQAKSVKDLRNLLDGFFQSPDFSDAYLLRQAEVDSRIGTPGMPRLVEFNLIVRGVFK